jgi:hypothetical protein
MKILFAVRSPGFFLRFFDGTIRDLAAQGHALQVVSHFGDRRQGAARKAADAASQARLRRYAAELSDFRWEIARRRSDRWRRPLSASRRLLDFASTITPGRQASRMVTVRSEGYLPGKVRRALRVRPVRSMLLHPAVIAALRWFERAAPPDGAIVEALRRDRPDVVVASPVLMPESDELEYVKAAAKLGIPTVVAVMSWDNLTTKGVLHVLPDMTIVWNQAQVEEAVRLHRVPRERAVYTGAPVFDEWFSLKPTMDRAAFCRQAGLETDGPYLLYLCSSRSIAQDETAFVAQVAAGLRAHPGTRHLSFLVRPHPSNAEIWQGYSSDLVSVWPPAGASPVMAHARQDFYHSLYYSAAALGVNTSALIEAAIVDRPCVTILAEQYRDTQQAIAHYQHLLNAGFLQVASDISSAADSVSAILQGNDGRREQRRRFLLDFVRPWGLDRPASRIMARAIEAVGQRRGPDQLQAQLAAESNSWIEPAGRRVAEAAGSAVAD